MSGVIARSLFLTSYGCLIMCSNILSRMRPRNLEKQSSQRLRRGRLASALWDSMPTYNNTTSLLSRQWRRLLISVRLNLLKQKLELLQNNLLPREENVLMENGGARELGMLIYWQLHLMLLAALYVVILVLVLSLTGLMLLLRRLKQGVLYLKTGISKRS